MAAPLGGTFVLLPKCMSNQMLRTGCMRQVVTMLHPSVGTSFELKLRLITQRIPMLGVPRTMPGWYFGLFTKKDATWNSTRKVKDNGNGLIHSMS